LWDGDSLLEETKYMMIDVEPGREYSFDISENKWLNIEDSYLQSIEHSCLCLLEVSGPDEIIAMEKRNCRICEDNTIYAGRTTLGGYLETAEYAEKFGDELAPLYQSQIGVTGQNLCTSSSEPFSISDATRVYARSSDLLVESSGQDLLPENYQMKGVEKLDHGASPIEKVYTAEPTMAGTSEELAQDYSETDGEGRYVGSITSNKYHRPDCRYAVKISPENRIWFADALDAQSKGYIPCKVCNPP
jgi:hypothetical protein